MKVNWFWVVIPSKIMEKLGWKKGQKITVDEKSNKITIEKDED